MEAQPGWRAFWYTFHSPITAMTVPARAITTKKEVSQEELETRRKIAIAIAIAMLLSGIETTVYYKKHNPDGSLKDNKPKKTYSVKHTAYDIKNESMNISNLQYDYENNEVTLGGEKIAKL